MANIIENLNWRYATKKYDASKVLSVEQVDSLMESVRLAPSSFGVQPYTIINIKDKVVREKLKAAAWGQTQITDASDLILFTVPTNLNDADIEKFIQNTSVTRGVSLESLEEYSNMIKGSVNSRTAEEKITWSAKQAYIALGILLVAAAEQKIDATPMEGFDNAQFDEILDLKSKGLTTVVIAALGYRSEDDHYAALAKVRKDKKDLYLEV
jgi:nitroreductase